MSAIFGLRIPFAAYCGIEALASEPGHTRLSLAARDDLLNTHGSLHGGALVTLLDIALATAARTLLDMPVTTVDLQTAFLAPGRGTVIGEGRVLRAGRSLVFCEGEVRDAAGAIVAKATGVFKVVGSKGGTGTR